MELEFIYSTDIIKLVLRAGLYFRGWGYISEQHSPNPSLVELISSCGLNSKLFDPRAGVKQWLNYTSLCSS